MKSFEIFLQEGNKLIVILKYVNNGVPKLLIGMLDTAQCIRYTFQLGEF